jgi:site-specific DNA-cytosine methylase
LQGFPCGWTRGLSFTRRCMLVGEAVCVPVVGWIAKRIGEAEV